MIKLVFILLSIFCIAQTDQYKEILLSKQIGKKVDSYRNGYGTIYNLKTRNENIVDSLGNIVYTSPINSSILHISKNKFILYLNEKNYKRKEGIIDEKGNYLIIPEYQDIGNWWNYKERIIITKNGKDGLFDYEGKQIIPFSDKISFAENDRFLVQNLGFWQIYDFDGKLVSDRKFDDDFYFEKGKALIDNEIIDINGKTLHTLKNHSIYSIENYPYLKTQNQDTKKYGLIDTDENIIAEEIYDEIFPEYSLENQGVIYLKRNKKTDVFSVKNKRIYPTDFDYINYFFGDLFSVYDEKTQKKGIINLNNKILFPQEFELAEHYNVSGEDFIYLKKGKEEQLLDKNLKLVLNSEFQLIAVFKNSFYFQNENQFFRFSVLDKTLAELQDVVLVKPQSLFFHNPIERYSTPIICKNKNGKFGLINGSGKEIVPFIYDDIIAFPNFENQLVVKNNGKYGVINYENEPLKEIIYDKYKWNKEVLHLEKNKNSESIYFTRIKNIEE